MPSKLKTLILLFLTSTVISYAFPTSYMRPAFYRLPNVEVEEDGVEISPLAVLHSLFNTGNMQALESLGPFPSNAMSKRQRFANAW